MKQRAIELFKSGIKSEATLEGYQRHLDRFCDFIKIHDHDKLASVSPDKIQIFIEDYIMHLKKTVSPNSVPTLIAGVRHFFIMNDVILNWKKFSKLMPEKVKKAGYNAWSTEDIKKMLNATKVLRNKAIIHFFASTGCRVGAFDYLTMSDIEDIEDCKAVRIYAGDKEEYFAFLTPEASMALEEYLEKRKIDGEIITKESPVFRTTYQLGSQKAKKLNYEAVKSLMFRLIRSNSNIQRKKLERNYDIQIDHGFRKRFNTIMKMENSVNANIAEKIMGHKRGLDGVYLTPTKLQCFNEFKKGILNLTISDENRQKVMLEQKEQEISELKEKDNEIDAIKKTQEQQQKDLDFMNNLHQVLVKDPEFFEGFKKAIEKYGKITIEHSKEEE